MAGLRRTCDVLVAVAAGAALAVDGLNRGVGAAPLVVVLSALATAPLLARHRFPVGVLLASSSGVVVCLLVFEPYDTAIAVLVVALYTVALHGHRRRSLLVGAVTAVGLTGLILAITTEPGTVQEAALRLGLAFGALVVGDAVRSRSELRAAAELREGQLAVEREQEQERRVLDERLRIARELHDTVAHALVAINVRAGVAAHLGADEQTGGALGDIMEVSSEALEELRTTLGLLRSTAEVTPAPHVLDGAAASELVDRVRALGVDAVLDVRLEDRALPTAVGQAGYRILQESLTNVVRHAQASRVTVGLAVEAEELRIDVHDDGSAAAGADHGGGGHGLRGMRERTAALGGQLDAGPCAAGGWRVRARLPLARGAG